MSRKRGLVGSWALRWRNRSLYIISAGEPFPQYTAIVWNYRHFHDFSLDSTIRPRNCWEYLHGGLPGHLFFHLKPLAIALRLQQEAVLHSWFLL